MTSRTAPRTLPRARTRPVAARVPRLRPLVVFALAAVVALFAMTYARISLDRSAFELQRLDAEIAREEARHWDLRVELARLQDPVRVTQVARDLGLVYPEERIRLEVAGLPARPAGGDGAAVEYRAFVGEQP